MGAGPALRPPPSSRLREVPAVAPGFASTLGGQCQLFGHFRGERKSLRGCARPASAVSHRSAPRHAAPPGCAPGAEAGPSRPASATASPSAPRAPAPALPSAAGGMRCRGGGRGGIHQPSEGGWQGTVRLSQGENTRLRVRHAAPTGRAGSRSVATPRHPRRRSRQARGGATRRPFSRRETEARRREGGSLPGVGTSTPAGLRGGGSPRLHAVLSAPGPARWLPLPPSRTGGLAHVARGARRLRRLPPRLDVAREAPSRRGRAPLSASPLPGPALSSSRPPSAHSADGAAE